MVDALALALLSRTDFPCGKARDGPFLAVGVYRPRLPWYVPRKHLEPYPNDDLSPPKVEEDDLDDGQSWENNGHCDLAPTRWWWKLEAWKAPVQAYLTSITFVDHHLGRPIDAFDRSGQVSWRRLPSHITRDTKRR